jgi:hypothetical protein
LPTCHNIPYMKNMARVNGEYFAICFAINFTRIRNALVNL